MSEDKVVTVGLVQDSWLCWFPSSSGHHDAEVEVPESVANRWIAAEDAFRQAHNEMASMVEEGRMPDPESKPAGPVCTTVEALRRTLQGRPAADAGVRPGEGHRRREVLMKTSWCVVSGVGIAVACLTAIGQDGPTPWPEDKVPVNVPVCWAGERGRCTPMHSGNDSAGDGPGCVSVNVRDEADAYRRYLVRSGWAVR